VKQLPNRNRRVWRDREWSLNDAQSPNPNVVRVASGTRYHRVAGDRRASRNGRVSDLPPEIPDVTIRTYVVAVCRPEELVDAWCK
jgi:hypothetical protein